MPRTIVVTAWRLRRQTQKTCLLMKRMKSRTRSQPSNQAALLAMLTEGIPSGFLNSPARVRPRSGSARSATVLSAGSEEGIVKQAILATVITVVKKQADSVAVLLQSEELNEANRIIHTGLNREHSFKSSGSILEVICSGDPKARAGDNVPVIVDIEPIQRVS